MVKISRVNPFTPLLLVLMLVCACERHVSFYDQTGEWDLYYLPLLKPYRLRSATKFEGGGSIDFLHPIKVKHPTINWYNDVEHTWVTHVNVTNGVIYGGQIYGNGRTFVLIPSKGIEMLFESNEAWTTYLKGIGINSEKTFLVSSLYEPFYGRHEEFTLA